MFIKKIILPILIVSLFGTMTNKIPLSAFASAFALLIVPFLNLKEKFIIPKFLWFLYIFTFYIIINVALFNFSSLYSYKFYRYDGNFFISYLPLLIYPLFCAKFNIEKILKIFLYFSCITTLIFYVIFFIKTKGGVLFNPSAQGNTFKIIFESSNAGGGFYSIIFPLALSFFLKERKKIYIMLGLLILMFLWGTSSRGSILGLILGCLFFYLYKNGRIIYIKLIFIIIIITQCIIISYTYPYYLNYLKNSNRSITIKDYYEAEGTKENNIYLRAYENWPRAVYLFLKSPLFGTGFGSVNDKPFNLEGINGVMLINNSKNKTFDSSHAHNSYLHFLAENGIVGFTLFLLFWIHLFKYIINLKKYIPKTIYTFLIINFFNLTIMSFTEHRITTPSNVLPFVLILVLSLMYGKYCRDSVNYNKINS
jgi:O-antigen ligase